MLSAPSFKASGHDIFYLFGHGIAMVGDVGTFIYSLDKVTLDGSRVLITL
jgi:hypothetical protein